MFSEEKKHFSLKNFSFFPKENSLFPKKVIFFTWDFFFIPLGTCLGLALNLFMLHKIIS
jgi:hypothetical protein